MIRIPLILGLLASFYLFYYNWRIALCFFFILWGERIADRGFRIWSEDQECWVYDPITKSYVYGNQTGNAKDKSKQTLP